MKMNMHYLNVNLLKLEYLYADNMISLLVYTKNKNRLLSVVEKDDDLSYDEERNQVYRVSEAKRNLKCEGKPFNGKPYNN